MPRKKPKNMKCADSARLFTSTPMQNLTQNSMQSPMQSPMQNQDINDCFR